jgi:pantoate--beta-alanine ligase
MGALHDGHLSLMRLAAQHADHVVTSIFVNPTQFGPDEDYDRYPRTLARDQKLCESAGVETLFVPDAATMYAKDATVSVVESGLSQVMCGASRPGHFNGVVTVVCKLFNIVQPDVAVFGQKDAQQLAIIRRMVRDLDIPVQIVAGPIVREPDGLAMSSRNRYLSDVQREQALCLSRGLEAVRNRYTDGYISVDEAYRLLAQQICDAGGKLEYAVCVDPSTLQPVETLCSGALVAVAVHIGQTRLIDNLVL